MSIRGSRRRRAKERARAAYIRAYCAETRSMLAKTFRAWHALRTIEAASDVGAERQRAPKADE